MSERIRLHRRRRHRFVFQEGPALPAFAFFLDVEVALSAPVSDESGMTVNLVQVDEWLTTLLASSAALSPRHPAALLVQLGAEMDRAVTSSALADVRFERLALSRTGLTDQVLGRHWGWHKALKQTWLSQGWTWSFEAKDPQGILTTYDRELKFFFDSIADFQTESSWHLNTRPSWEKTKGAGDLPASALGWVTRWREQGEDREQAAASSADFQTLA